MQLYVILQHFLMLHQFATNVTRNILTLMMGCNVIREFAAVTEFFIALVALEFKGILAMDQTFVFVPTNRAGVRLITAFVRTRVRPCACVQVHMNLEQRPLYLLSAQLASLHIPHDTVLHFLDATFIVEKFLLFVLALVRHELFRNFLQLPLSELGRYLRRIVADC